MEPLYTCDSIEAPLCVSFMRVLQCCSTELAAPGRHAAVLKRHTMWSLYIHVMDTVCCSAGLAALVRYTTGKLWICSIMLQVQKSKRKVLVTTVKWGRLTTCNCSIILHKVHFLVFYGQKIIPDKLLQWYECPPPLCARTLIKASGSNRL